MNWIGRKMGGFGLEINFWLGIGWVEIASLGRE